MSYLKLMRCWVIVGAFVSFSMFVVLFPAVDLAVARLAFNGTAFPYDAWWVKLQQGALSGLIGAVLLAVVAVYAWNRLRGRKVMKIDGHKVAYLFAVLIIGAGLIVNLGLKDNFGRARPRDIAEFGGPMHFTPAYTISQECTVNCSFSSGDSAAGFFALAVAMVLGRRRGLYIAAGTVGATISVLRIAAGAHFFSDTVVSFFVMLIVSDVLYHYMISLPAARELLPCPKGARVAEDGSTPMRGNAPQAL